METLKAEVAAQLRLKAVEGGFEPEEGVEVTVVVDTGSSAISLGRVTQILTASDAWIVCREGDGEVAWVRPESVVMIRVKGLGAEGGKGRTGFG